MVVYEEGCGLVCRAMFDLPEGQGRAPTPSWEVATLRGSTMEVGADQDGFHYIIAIHYKGFDSIWVIVDHLTKSAHFLAISEGSSAEKLAEIYVREMVAWFGVPTSIVSNRDVRFTSIFWKRLHKDFGNQLHFSTAYHP